MTAWLANFDFDYAIAPTPNGQGVTLPRAVRTRTSALAGLFVLLAGDGDVIHTAGVEPPTVVGEGLPAVVFSADPPPPDAIAWGSVTPLSVVRHLNDRAFAASFDEVDVQVVTSADELDLSTEARPFVLKTRWSGFGRGVRVILADDDDATLLGWIERGCRRGGLTCEPLFEIFSEAATHFELTADGARRLGQTTSRVDAARQVVAIEAPRAELPQFVVTRSETVAEAAWATGYRGRLSIDHALVRGRTSPAWRAVQDVNARWTLGSLALAAAVRTNAPVSLRLDDSLPDWPPVRTWISRGIDGRTVAMHFGEG